MPLLHARWYGPAPYLSTIANTQLVAFALGTGVLTSRSAIASLIPKFVSTQLRPDSTIASTGVSVVKLQIGD
ncbi:hypothetical protein [Hymenobacter negativus]|uniref:Uncharacterized protein n=1 Tax=Hymenobacter negativus TaxID=2795026 RepID=A0ABS0Q6L4_9BACT|nr:MULTISPECIES: hypothetical protein [Bacteria]MBH8557891.1 hypothetical protein [Hymenobacter negativus]MBH8567573.1 hypothetical protein [Hymenobacter negativus]MBR7207305.1 hypothetical protein [Microvirga sp. STS02]